MNIYMNLMWKEMWLCTFFVKNVSQFIEMAKFCLGYDACIYCFLQKFGKFSDFHCLYEGTFYCGIIFTIAHTTYFHFSIHHFDPTQVKCRLLISSIFDAMNFQHFLEMQEIMLQHGEIPRQGKIKLSKLMSFHFSYFKNIIKLLRK